MKLFDLLKSLNNDTAVDPDARPKSPAEDRRLLDELQSLLNLLDTPAPVSAAHFDVLPAAGAPPLNLATIFDESTEPDSAAPAFAAVAAATSIRRPVVRELLDEFLPMLAQALGERLDQLDDATLQQWRQVIAERSGQAEPTGG